MSQDPIIYRNILENMTDGVMTVSLDGRIMTFNEAAERILGLRAEDVLGRSLGEVFLGKEGSDAFNQAILDAVYSEAVTQNASSCIRPVRSTSFFPLRPLFSGRRDGTEKEGRRHCGLQRPDGVEALRETEQSLTEEIKAKHKELQNPTRNWRIPTQVSRPP